MPDTPPPPERMFPQDNLPEVRPPSARFILQLFGIPAFVVLAIVLVWLLFSWLAHMGRNPAEIVREMKKNNAGSWQEASNLANELRRNEAARSDPKFAKEVADYLKELLAQPLPQPLPKEEDPEKEKRRRDPRGEEAKRRGFLCRALGEFTLPDEVLSVLLQAAQTGVGSRDEADITLRAAAIQGIALLAENVRKTKPLTDPRVVPALVRASGDQERIIASAGAYALGVLGGDQAIKRLKVILREGQPAEVHYNAATALARLGKTDSQAIILLKEMINPDSTRGLDSEEEGDKAGKRSELQINGVRALEQLAEQDPKADLSSVIPVLKKLQDSKAPAGIKVEAAGLLRKLEERGGAK